MAQWVSVCRIGDHDMLQGVYDRFQTGEMDHFNQ